MLTFGRLRATSNKDVEQAVEQGRTRMSNKVDEQARTSDKCRRTSDEQAGLNKGVKQGRTSDAQTSGRTRMSNKRRTMSSKEFLQMKYNIYIYIYINTSAQQKV